MGIYISMTLKELVEGIQEMIRTEDDLTGEEYVMDAYYIGDEDQSRYPPGSVCLRLQAHTLKKEEFKEGTLVLTPKRLTERLM